MPSVYAGWHRFGLESKRKPETSEWDQISIKFAVRVCKNVRHMRWRQLEFLEARIHPWTLNFVDEIQIEIPANAVNKKRSCCKPFSRSALNPITTSQFKRVSTAEIAQSETTKKGFHLKSFVNFLLSHSIFQRREQHVRFASLSLKAEAENKRKSFCLVYVEESRKIRCRNEFREFMYQLSRFLFPCQIKSHLKVKPGETKAGGEFNLNFFFWSREENEIGSKFHFHRN